MSYSRWIRPHWRLVVHAVGLVGLVGLVATASLAPFAAASTRSATPGRGTHRTGVAHGAPGPLAGHAVTAALGARGSLVTYGYGNSRSGDDTESPPIRRLSAAPAWNDDSLDGAVFGQPLVSGGSVYVATENDSIYAIGAHSGTVLWRAHVGTPARLAVVDTAPTLNSGCGDIDPLGITGTPVIDPVAGVIYAAEETMLPGANNWQHVRHWIVAVSLTTHRELWHRDVDPPHANHAGTYYIPTEQQRPALTLFAGRLYVSFGGLANDCGQYHGYVVGLAATGRGPLRSYRVPTQREGAIWATGGAMVSPAGQMFVATGNGSSSSLQHFDEGNSVVELSPGLARLGVWAPSDWVQLNQADWDLGSSGPIQVPGTSLLFVAGKPSSSGSFGYLMSEHHLDGVGRGAFTGRVCPGGGVFGADATDTIGTGPAARILVFVPCGSGTEALQVSTSPARFKRLWSASTGGPNGSPTVAGGMVWALDFNSGHLYGMSPRTGRVLVQRATDPLEHFVAPAVGDGMLLVPTSSGVEAFRTAA